MKKNNTLIVDLDNTITVESRLFEYPEKPLNNEVRRSIINASKYFNIHIFTARNMKSLDGDLDKILKITKPIAKKWLKQNNVEYDEITFGKPFCGKHGFYIDDKNLSIEEFNFKFGNPYWEKSFDIVIPFYNEEENIYSIYNDVKRLERLFNIEKYYFINNGSSDNSNIIFDDLVNRDEKIEIVNIEKNIGYGFGVKAGLKKSKSDFVIINHSDKQFDTYSYFITNMIDIMNLSSADTIFSYRLNRTLKQRIITKILNVILSIFTLKIIKDFNGQPKVINMNNLKKDIEFLPNDFSLDFSIYKKLKPNYFLPVIQKNREKGESSWSNGDFFKKLSILNMYIKESFK